MRAVIQRVSQARVKVEGSVLGEIGPGLLALLGIAKPDTAADAEFLAEKILSLRVFPDQAGKMNRSLLDTGGALLVVSQFTLYGDVRKGARPGFDGSAPPDHARLHYERFVTALRSVFPRVSTGEFQAHMRVSLVNDGPVTILIDNDSPGAPWVSLGRQIVASMPESQR
jgi:D-tyrosyl-tRNA(Tyr) deacylase